MSALRRFGATPGSPVRLGKYHLLNVLGEGGMGCVYLVEDPDLHRRVALKAMTPEMATWTEALERFLREARSQAQVEHEGIVPIYSVEEDGTPFLTMPLLQGETLKECLARERVLLPAEVVRLGREVAEALDAANKKRLIHRDIKPANRWLELHAGTRRVKVLDFGLARPMTKDDRITSTNAFLRPGTPKYMSPEQLNGEELDVRTDLFSLGCVLYEMATGKSTFRPPNLVAPRDHNPDISERLSALILRLVDEDRGKRLASAREVADEMAGIRDDPLPPSNDANPYDPWTPARGPRFVGRREELSRMQQALDGGRSVSLVGDWRIGKSSLLEAWAQRARKAGRVVCLLSGEGPEGKSAGAFVKAVTGRESPDDGDAAGDNLDRWVEKNGRPGLPPLLVVDETDVLLGTFEHRFFERLRGILGRIALVLGSRRELDVVYQNLGRTSPFYNRLEVVWLGLIESEACEEMIGWGQTFLTDEDRSLLREWAGRHPYYLQLLGHHLYQAQRESRRPDQTLDRFRTEAAARLRELERTLDDRERAALRGSVNGAPSSLRILRDRGLVGEDGRPFGRVLAEWLRGDL